MPYTCMTDDDNMPVILVTNLETGDTVGACPEHIALVLLSLVESVTGTAYTPVGESVPDAETDDETDDDDAAPDAAPVPPPGEVAPPTAEPGGPTPDDDEDQDHDQMAEDQAAYGEELAAQVGHRVSG